MRDPVREALYGSLRRRDHSPQRVIPSRELRRIKVSGGLVARARASRTRPECADARCTGFPDEIFIRRTATWNWRKFALRISDRRLVVGDRSSALKKKQVTRVRDSSGVPASSVPAEGIGSEIARAKV